uniref:Uncharacterized protein n=1 Tax=Salix viminalis TaxID=40686 RepID=A0A6N2KHY5_SALVM
MTGRIPVFSLFFAGLIIYDTTLTDLIQFNLMIISIQRLPIIIELELEWWFSGRRHARAQQSDESLFLFHRFSVAKPLTPSKRSSAARDRRSQVSKPS